ncbi:SAM-dependent methyltransferase [Streptomyces tendae]|uniref:SAM-dependent methyltransferase n=1 Tax=Streptomyces tendae TaxID=1932 RepID=UPI0016758A7C|nr:methyltransferase domain-containing protein [Streptomyces tendae]
MESVQAAMAARSAVRSWAEGLELIELVRATHRAGWLKQLRGETTAAELAAAHGTSVKQVSEVLAVLSSANVVRPGDGSSSGDSFRLSPEFDALVAGAAGVEMTVVLDAVELARSQVARAVRPTDQEPGAGIEGAQALVLARDWGLRPTPAARQLIGMLYEALPEFRARLESGGPLLDVGTGVGGALITGLTLFEGLRAVGVESVPEVAAECRRRTEAAGVADRVDIRTTDARALSDESAFSACFWAQPFFSEDVRADTLTVIFRALRPDGLLLVQELFPPGSTQDEPTLRAGLDRLFFTQRHIPFGLSAEELAAEGHAAGFRDARVTDSALGKLVLMRKPDC